MKKVIRLIFSVLLVAAFGASRAYAVHLRLQETSITENGRVQSEPELRLKTKGYGVTWIFPFGLGVAYTQLHTTGKRDTASIDLNHSYVDVSYTAGESWLATFGYGVGVAGRANVNGRSADGFRATAWSLGVGYRFSAFEIYWINRLNFPRYQLDGQTVNVTSTHYQMGLGLYLP